MCDISSGSTHNWMYVNGIKVKDVNCLMLALDLYDTRVGGVNSFDLGPIYNLFNSNRFNLSLNRYRLSK